MQLQRWAEFGSRATRQCCEWAHCGWLHAAAATSPACKLGVTSNSSNIARRRAVWKFRVPYDAPAVAAHLLAFRPIEPARREFRDREVVGIEANVRPSQQGAGGLPKGPPTAARPRSPGRWALPSVVLGSARRSMLRPDRVAKRIRACSCSAAAAALYRRCFMMRSERP